MKGKKGGKRERAGQDRERKEWRGKKMDLKNRKGQCKIGNRKEIKWTERKGQEEQKVRKKGKKEKGKMDKGMQMKGNGKKGKKRKRRGRKEVGRKRMQGIPPIGIHASIMFYLMQFFSQLQIKRTSLGHLAYFWNLFQKVQENLLFKAQGCCLFYVFRHFQNQRGFVLNYADLKYWLPESGLMFLDVMQLKYRLSNALRR